MGHHNLLTAESLEGLAAEINFKEMKSSNMINVTLNLNAHSLGVECLYSCLLAVGVTGGGGGAAEFAIPI